jgi:hypothetical protein
MIRLHGFSRRFNTLFNHRWLYNFTEKTRSGYGPLFRGMPILVGQSQFYPQATVKTGILLCFLLHELRALCGKHLESTNNGTPLLPSTLTKPPEKTKITPLPG